MRGGGPPLSVGPAGRAERLLTFLQGRGPSPRTERCGRRCHLFPAPLSNWSYFRLDATADGEVAFGWLEWKEVKRRGQRSRFEGEEGGG